MQWMFRRHNSWPGPGIGGGYPAMAGYRALLLDPTLPEKAPAWKSEFFPNTAFMLRNNFPDPRETQLLLLAGSFGGWRSHWDDDSGSITLWGKGRIVANDYGYYGMAPGADHNQVESPARGGVMYVKNHAETNAVDYVDGVSGGWRRQIAMIKDADPLGPNYFVLCDSFTKPSPATWRLWLTAAEVQFDRTGQGDDQSARADRTGKREYGSG